jgi:phosphoglucan,water dikinase
MATTTRRAVTREGPFHGEEARETLATLADEVRRNVAEADADSTAERRKETRRADGHGDAGSQREVVKREDDELVWSTMRLVADDGSRARLVYAVRDGALTLRVDRVECRGSDARDLLLHWGVQERAGGDWISPFDALERVPSGSRAPDGKSCESGFDDARDGTQSITLDLAKRGGDVQAVVCLVRTQDCKVWFKDECAGDVVLDVRDAVRGVEKKPAPVEVRSVEPEPKPTAARRESVSGEPTKPMEDEQFAALSQWRGQEVKLQNFKGGNGDRNLRWNTDNLADAARRIVEGDRDSSSWRQKLQMVERLICDNGADVDSLAYVTVYLFWISVGAIACVEDGTHYRPNHHAGSAERMFGAIEAAERFADELTHRGEHHGSRELRALIRRLHPRLPAFTAEFTQSVPLTRIRDIAHGKGDEHGKCREVRQEIKHTIQNKLHRCAGPEDLVATEAMLAKLTAPGTDYPEAFVNEFKIFYRELKEFFNASSVADRIERIANEQGAPQRASSSSKAFLDAKARVDALPSVDSVGDQVTLSSLIECLKTIHSARVDIDAALRSGGELENAQAATRQQWRLAEVGMEDYAFVLLSRLLNTLGAETEPPRTDVSVSEVKLTLEALALTSRTMALSTGGDQELDAVAAEAETLARNGLPAGEEGGLRVQAIAERARRGAVDFCSLLESLFDGRANSLGNALGIDDGSVNVFTEGQIRASVVFQSAKLATLLLRVSRQITGAAGWDCVVQGTAVGELKCVDRLTPEACAGFDKPVVLLVESADGDEEVSTCGPNVRGIVLCHALPHLSHLALRARQARIPLIAVEDDKLVDYARGFVGQEAVKLIAEASSITLDVTTETMSTTKIGEKTATSKSTPQLVADLSKASSVIDLVELHDMGLSASMRMAGSKSAMCAQLSAIAARSAKGYEFKAPEGVALPFGAMEIACAAMGKLEQLETMIDRLADVNEAAEMKASCDAIQDLIRSVRPSDETLDAISNKFSSGARVMVRSSANVEDLEGMSAAGLYDSIANVDAGSRDALGVAIAEVWASLFTTRAVASRASAGVHHLGAHMCVLVQEMLAPEVSFVFHTSHPLTNDGNSAYAEFALGLGETLASGAVRGTPCRVSIDKATKTATVNAFASFGTALVRDDDSPTGMKSVAADYASHWLNNDSAKRNDVAVKMLEIGLVLERELSPNGSTLAQDIEGCILPDGTLCIVQARPQP